MINIGIQILTLFSALLVNFLIPLLFGLEEYGVFIKANILVFLFQKIVDVVSEPLISTVEKDQLLPLFLGVAGLALFIFFVANLFFSAGSPILLSTMYWSNGLLLVMYAQQLHKLVLFYLALFNVIFLVLLASLHQNWLNITIPDVLSLTNMLPSTLCFFWLFVNKKLAVSFTGTLNNLKRIILLIPSLCSLTLVSNFFTNILPFYLSFVITPQLLGLFKVQTSILQSVAAIFPINAKIISASFLDTTKKSYLIESWIRFSMNYFYMISILGVCVAHWYGRGMGLSKIFILLPLLHLAFILERFLLGMRMRKELIIINIIVTLTLCSILVFVRTIPQIILFYGVGTSLYVLFMIGMAPITLHRFKSIVIGIVFLTPVLIYITIDSDFFSSLALLLCASIVFLSIPMNKRTLSLLRG